MRKFRRIIGLGLTLGLLAFTTACDNKDNKTTKKDDNKVTIVDDNNNDNNNDNIIDNNDDNIIDNNDDNNNEDNNENDSELVGPVYEKGLSSKDYNFEQEFFFDDYNKRSVADTNRQGVEVFTDKDIIFDAITYEELISILESEGKYLFFFGGSWCHNTRAAAPYINSIAKEYGVEKIYNFDFYLDGTNGSTHVRNSSPVDPKNTTTNVGVDYNFLYVELVRKYLTNLDDFVEYDVTNSSALKFNEKGYNPETDEQTIIPKLQVPFLFYYDKDNAEGPIVNAFEEMVDLDANGIYKGKNADGSRKYITSTYETNIHGFFDSIKNSEGTVTLTDYSDKDYIINTYNSKARKEIFASDSQINIQVITYRQLDWLLNQEGNSIILLGGTWCGNTQASIKPFNDFAVENDVIIYNFDTKLDSGIGKSKLGYSEAHIRESETKLTSLYVDLIEKYFTNIVTLYDVNSTKSSQYISLTKDEVTNKVNKLQVPYLLSYNKDALDEDGEKAPITAYYEEMLSLSQTSKTYVYSETNYKSIQDNTNHVIHTYLKRIGECPEEVAEDTCH